MVQKKILLDSNVYFRLANNIRPLLFIQFGDENYCLYPESVKEFPDSIFC